MTKLEEKLIELGYTQFTHIKTYFQKEFNCAFHKVIFLNDQLTEVKGHKISPYGAFRTQQDIDNLQLAFNEMQKDLEILKKCKENEK